MIPARVIGIVFPIPIKCREQLVPASWLSVIGIGTRLILCNV